MREHWNHGPPVPHQHPAVPEHAQHWRVGEDNVVVATLDDTVMRTGDELAPRIIVLVRFVVFLPAGTPHAAPAALLVVGRHDWLRSPVHEKPRAINSCQIRVRGF